MKRQDSDKFKNIRTEGIKYAGSKVKIIPYIFQILSDLDEEIVNVLDGFSGTTRVSQAFGKMGYNTTSMIFRFGPRFWHMLFTINGFG